MKAIQTNNEEIKTTNTQLRRKTMKTAKFTMIVLSATAIFLGGCSGDNRVTAPDDFTIDEELAFTMESDKQLEAENNAARIATESYGQEIEREDFTATVYKSEVEGGCWYLENVEFARYTPYFEGNAPRLHVGQNLHVFGYVDKNMSSFCMIGPVFHIEKYKILSGNENRLTSEIDTELVYDVVGQPAVGNADVYRPVAEDAVSHSATTILKGYYGTSKEGCMYITDGREIIVELNFNQRICPNIRNGSLIAVKGEYSLLAWSPCQLAPLFNVEKFQVLVENDLAAKDASAGK
jgi:hypothetical protein